MPYCDFNIKLFKPFTSMKTKIEPQLSDDWEINPNTYNLNNGFILTSKKLNQSVADIDLRNFLRFCKDENLVIEGLKLNGTFVIGSDRKVYTERDFNKWTNKFSKRTETIIPKKDWIPGHKYKTPCGSEIIYIGKKYQVKIKDNRDGDKRDYSICTKPSQIYFYKKGKSLSVINQKFTEDLGEVYSNEERENEFNNYFSKNPLIVYLSNDKPKGDLKVKLKETELSITNKRIIVVEDVNGKMCTNICESLDLIINNEGKIVISNYYSRYCVKTIDVKSLKSIESCQVGVNLKTAFEFTI